MELGLNGKSVVITGGATGIGKAAVMEFLREGCHVSILGRRQEKLDAVCQQVREMGYDILARSVDIRDEAALRRFADEVEAQYGGIDVWINNAGANHIQGLMEYSRQEFSDMVDLLLVSVFSGCQIAAEHMKKAGKGGVILNASSFAALIPNAGRAPYSACKAAVSSLTRTFAAELASSHIRVVSYIPGMFDTDMNKEKIAADPDFYLRSIPMRRFGQPEDLAKVLVFLSSDCAGYINGVDVEVSGGKFCVQNPQYSYQ